MAGAAHREAVQDAWDSIEGEIDLGATESVANKIDLRARTKPRPGKAKDDFDPVAAAEAAMNRLSPSFGLWMENKVGIAQDALVGIQKHGLDAKTLDPLFRAIHEIKGEAATFGFPLAGEVALSLYRLCERVPGPQFIPVVLVTQHIQAIRAIVSEGQRDEGNSTARKLVVRLKEVTEEYLGHLPDTKKG
ncbi:MAG: Hpt domain-containing protein [Hyphomicrobiaceae bacterium]|nr:Hpt domain-containing protein [Hyphomicrobiaceae bacterium]